MQVQELACNYIFFWYVRWKKKLIWRPKLWLAWKRCAILAWLSHMWVAQTCESVKQTTRIASAVTIWERSWSLSIFYSLKSSYMAQRPFCWCNPKLGCLVLFSRLQLCCRTMLHYATRINNIYCSHINNKVFLFFAFMYSKEAANVKGVFMIVAFIINIIIIITYFFIYIYIYQQGEQMQHAIHKVSIQSHKGQQVKD